MVELCKTQFFFACSIFDIRGSADKDEPTYLQSKSIDEYDEEEINEEKLKKKATKS